jgi:hypothetical protein
MTNPIQILSVEQDGQDGIIVKFSDTTTAGYVVEELLGLRPKRKWTSETPEIPDPDGSVLRGFLPPRL